MNLHGFGSTYMFRWRKYLDNIVVKLTIYLNDY